jgi:hypothetical protein
MITNSKKRLWVTIFQISILVYMVFSTALWLKFIESHEDYKVNLRSIIRYCLDNK